MVDVGKHVLELSLNHFDFVIDVFVAMLADSSHIIANFELIKVVPNSVLDAADLHFELVGLMLVDFRLDFELLKLMLHADCLDSKQVELGLDFIDSDC